MTIRVVVVEDSPTMRAILMSRLAEEPDIAVVATAANAQEGRELIKQFDPDVVTLDIEMPGMNGLDFLDKIMALRPTPVIIISGSTQEGAATTAEALARGAVACYAKPQSGMTIDATGRLADLIREAAQVRFHRAPPPPRRPASARGTAPHGRATGHRHAPARAAAPLLGSSCKSRIVGIGSSTGGVEALHAILSAFPAIARPRSSSSTSTPASPARSPSRSMRPARRACCWPNRISRCAPGMSIWRPAITATSPWAAAAIRAFTPASARASR